MIISLSFPRWDFHVLVALTCSDFLGKEIQNFIFYGNNRTPISEIPLFHQFGSHYFHVWVICILAVRWFSHHSKVSIPLIRLVAMANVSLEGVPLPTRVLALLPTLCVLQLHGGLEVPGPNLEVLVRNCQATMDCKRVRATQESVVKILQKQNVSPTSTGCYHLFPSLCVVLEEFCNIVLEKEHVDAIHHWVLNILNIKKTMACPPRVRYIMPHLLQAALRVVEFNDPTQIRQVGQRHPHPVFLVIPCFHPKRCLLLRNQKLLDKMWKFVCSVRCLRNTSRRPFRK